MYSAANHCASASYHPGASKNHQKFPCTNMPSESITISHKWEANTMLPSERLRSLHAVVKIPLHWTGLRHVSDSSADTVSMGVDYESTIVLTSHFITKIVVGFTFVLVGIFSSIYIGVEIFKDFLFLIFIATQGSSMVMYRLGSRKWTLDCSSGTTKTLFTEKSKSKIE